MATRLRVNGVHAGEDGRVDGVEGLRPGRRQAICASAARHVIVAGGAAHRSPAGSWATGHAHHELRPSKGVHLLVPRGRIPMQSGLFMRTEKSIFHAIPWGPDHWLLGDTDTDWERRSGGSRWPAGADVEYVLGKVNEVLVDPLTTDDVRGRLRRPAAAGGPRPGAADTTRLSRDHRLFDVRGPA